MEARLLCLVVALLCVPLPLFGDPGFGEIELPESVVMGVLAAGADVQVTLRWNPSADLSLPRRLVLRNRDRAEVAAVPVNPAQGLPRENLPDVLDRLTDIGFQLFLTVEDFAGVGGDPFPLFVLRRCSLRGGCAWQILEGLDSDAVVISGILDDALDAIPGCDLEAQMQQVEEEQPHLMEEVDQMRLQLRRVGLEPCSHFWQGVAYASSITTNFASTLSTDAGVPDAEVMGFLSGAAHCQSAQARRLSPGWTIPPTVFNNGFSGIVLKLRCAGGSVGCRQGCGGDVDVLADYEACAVAEALNGTYASGTARSRDEVWLLLNSTIEREEEVEVMTTGDPAQNGDGFLHTAEARQPVNATLWTFRELAVTAQYTPPTTPSPGSKWISGIGYAFTEVGNRFHLGLTATADDHCTISDPEAHVYLESPDYTTATRLAERGGSIKIEKW